MVHKYEGDKYTLVIEDNTATVSHRYTTEEEGSVTLTKKDIALDVPAGKTIANVKIDKDRICTPYEGDQKSSGYFETGLPATLTAESFNRFVLAGGEYRFDDAEMVAEYNKMSIEAVNTELKFVKDGKLEKIDLQQKIEGVIVSKGSLFVVFEDQNQPPKVFSNLELRTYASILSNSDKNEVIMAFNKAQFQFKFCVDNMDENKFTPDGFRVKDVMQSLLDYAVAHGNQSKCGQCRTLDKTKTLKEATAELKKLADMFGDPKLAKDEFNAKIKHSMYPAANMALGMLTLIGAGLILGLSIALTVAAPLFFPILMLGAAGGIFMGHYGGAKIYEGAKDLKHNVNANQFRMWAEHKDQANEPKNAIQRAPAYLKTMTAR